MSGMAEVLAAHRYRGGSNPRACRCGHVLPSALDHDGNLGDVVAAHQADALSAAGFGSVAEAKAGALDYLIADSPRLPTEVRNVVFEAVFDVADKFNLPLQNMGPRRDLVEIGDVCGDIEKRIVAILRAAELRKP